MTWKPGGQALFDPQAASVSRAEPPKPVIALIPTRSDKDWIEGPGGIREQMLTHITALNKLSDDCFARDIACGYNSGLINGKQTLLFLNFQKAL